LAVDNSQFSIPEIYGPWEVAGYQVRIDCEAGVRLEACRDGQALKALPAAVRESPDLAWIRMALEAATQHRRDLKTLLQTAMVEEIPITGDDLAMLALDPVGRPMLQSLLFEIDGTVGRPLPDDWMLETLPGDLLRLSAPARVAHPVNLEASGTLPQWNAWLNRQSCRQPFKQIRREVYLPNANDVSSGTFSDRFAGEVVRWDQARALLEGRGWYRVTKTGAERIFRSAGLTAYVEFRTPAARGFSLDDVVLNRVFFLPRGEQVANRANPGISVESVPRLLFSEALLDVALVAHVARRDPGF
jgi:hypothetical protein